MAERGYAYVREDLESFHQQSKIIDPEHEHWHTHIRPKLAEKAAEARSRGEEASEPMFTEDPASLDIKAGNYAWKIDTSGGEPMFVPDPNKSVEEMIESVPSSRRQKIRLGTEPLEPHYLYFIPAQQQLQLGEDERVFAPGSSSIARIFPDVRLYTDYSARIDELVGRDWKGSARNLWLSVQPNVFSLVVHPGTPLTQIIWTKGKDFWVTDKELIGLNEQQIKEIGFGLANELVDGKLFPIMHPVIRDGLESTLDLGNHSEGIVALMAKNTNTPIDLSMREHYQVEEFFYLLLADDNKTLVQRPRIPYIYLPREIQKIPTSVIAVHDRHDDSAYVGPKEKAGLFNPGDLTAPVYEGVLMQNEPIRLRDGMPMSRTRYIRLRKPAPDYTTIGTESAKRYGNQFCINPAKFFERPDWKEKLRFAHKA